MASNSVQPSESSPLDAQTLERARVGDAKALQRICQYLEPRLRRALAGRLGRLGQKVRVSDVLQSTFVDIVRSAGAIPQESGEHVERWGMRVLDNNIRDLARYFTAGRRDRSLEKPLDAGHRVAAIQPSPATAMVNAEDVTRLALAIRDLPDDYQRILHIFLRPDFSHELASETMGRSVGASRVLLARARAALLLRLEK